jgi:putative aldouronate transport system substrate-binding protein
MWGRGLALLVVGLMIIGMAACGGGGSTGATTTAAAATTAAATTAAADNAATEAAATTAASAAATTAAAADGEVVELSILSLPANTSGLAEGWWADEVEKAVGVRLNLIPSGDQGEQKLQALMASGELPDLVVFKDYKQLENAVDGDMLLAYDDYKDLVPNVYANAGVSLRFMADNFSKGKGKAYAAGLKIKTAQQKRGETGPYIRYDVYKEVGAPQFHNLTELLDVLEKMQEAEPVNADGQKVYALSLFKDWDRSYMTLGMFCAPHLGVQIPNEASLAEIHPSEDLDSVVSIVSEGSTYLEFVRFCYEANQRGILDPDSITQRFDDSVQKTAAGRVLFSLDGWGASDFSTNEKQEQGIGFRPVTYTGVKRLMGALQPVGTPWVMSVSATSKQVEKAMAFVNWNYSFEGSRITENGPKDVMWEIGEDGAPRLTEFYYEYQLTPDAEFAAGKNYAKGGSPINALALAQSVIDPSDGFPISRNLWNKPPYAPADTKLVQEWQKDFDALDMLDYYWKDESRILVNKVGSYPSMNDEMEQISARAGDIIKTASWKMVYAKDEAEYNAIKDQMVKDAESVGIQRWVDWFIGEYELKKAEASKYAN